MRHGHDPLSVSPSRPALKSVPASWGSSGRSSRRRDSQWSFRCFRLVVVTIVGVAGASFGHHRPEQWRPSGRGRKTFVAFQAFRDEPPLVTTAGAPSGTACFLRDGCFRPSAYTRDYAHPVSAAVAAGAASHPDDRPLPRRASPLQDQRCRLPGIAPGSSYPAAGHEGRDRDHRRAGSPGACQSMTVCRAASRAPRPAACSSVPPGLPAPPYADDRAENDRQDHHRKCGEVLDAHLRCEARAATACRRASVSSQQSCDR